MTGYIHPEIAHLSEPLASLHHYHRNPRRHADDVIIGSLRRNGQYRPVVGNVGTHTGRPREVLAGNGTMDAALELGWDALAVTWVDVDEQAAKRIVLVDNRANDLATNDDEQIAELLAELRDAEGEDGLGGAGYTEEDLDDLLAGLASPDLDDLHGVHGDPTDEDGLVRISFRVTEDVAAMWRSAGDATGMYDDVARDSAVVRAAYDSLCEP